MCFNLLFQNHYRIFDGTNVGNTCSLIDKQCHTHLKDQRNDGRGFSLLDRLVNHLDNVVRPEILLQLNFFIDANVVGVEGP